MKILIRVLKTFILSLFGVVFFLNVSAYNSPDCKDIEAIKTEVVPTAGINQSNGRLGLLLPAGSQISDFKIHLFAPRRENNRIDIKSKVIEGLSKGTYYLIIQSENGDCTRKISVEIN